MALISERFSRFASRKAKLTGLQAASQNDLTTKYKYAPDAAEALKMYKKDARKAGATPHDVLQRLDSKSLIEFAKKHNLIK